MATVVSSSAASSSPQKSTTGRTVVPAYLRAALGFADRWAPAWGARVAGDLFTTPPRYERPADEVAVLARGERFAIPLTLKGGQVPLAAWRWDEDRLGLRHRPVAILVHGWGGRGGQLHTFVGPLQAAGFSVVTFDMPAHGDTPGRRTNLPEFAWALGGMVAHLGAPAVLVTHSMGGGAALLAATADWIPKAARTALAGVPVAFLAPPLDPEAYTRRFGHLVGIGPRTIDELGERFRSRVGVGWDQVAFAPAAARFEARAFVAHDTDDGDVPIENGLAFARSLADVELHVTSGLGHRRILRDAEVIDGVVRFATA